MRPTFTAPRLGLAAASLLLVLGAACSPAGPDAPVSSGPSATPIVPTPAETTGPPTAAPGPSGTASSLPAPATTPVPPPTPGDINSTVPSRPEESKKPVKLDQSSNTGTGLSVTLTSIKAVNAKAQLPGEVAGPAVAIAVKVTNSSAKAVALDTVVVSLADADEAPGTEMTAAPAKPLKDSVAASKTASGTYVFTVPKNKRNPITLTVTIGEAPVLVYTGDAR